MSYSDKIIEKIDQLMQDEEITGYRIEQDTGVSAPITSRLRSGSLQVENMKFKTVMTLFEYYSNIERQRKRKMKKRTDI